VLKEADRRRGIAATELLQVAENIALAVQFVRAEKLPKADMFGTCDPFVTVTIVVLLIDFFILWRENF
jgi:hypothetical protein